MSLELSSCLTWGAIATIVMTTTLAFAQGLGLTRMNMPYLLGSMVTSHRDRARLIGILTHAFNGFAFSILYALVFDAWGGATWWRGALLGVLQSCFLLAVVLPAMPALHPRMASETAGPTVTRQLEPPGFLGLHYGPSTPACALAAHVAYGIIVGAFYVGRP